jgi:hypothetical protein
MRFTLLLHRQLAGHTAPQPRPRGNIARGMLRAVERKKGRTSFLKKRSKKLLFILRLVALKGVWWH